MAKKKTNGTIATPADAKTKSIREIRLSESFGSFYTNDTQVETGVWDVRMRFGLVHEVDKPNNTLMVVQVAEVRMSLEHAKRVHSILGEQLEGYQKRFGKLPDPTAGESTEP